MANVLHGSPRSRGRTAARRAGAVAAWLAASLALADTAVPPAPPVQQPAVATVGAAHAAPPGSPLTPGASSAPVPASASPAGTSTAATATPGSGGHTPWGGSAPRAVSTVAAVPHVSGSIGTAAAAGLFEDLEYLTGPALSRRLDEYARLGVRIARFQVIWANVQAAGPGSYDWQYVDAVVSGLGARGIAALPVLDTTPTWARPGDCTTQLVCAPADAAAYAGFAAAAAARYAPQDVHSWEIWNEPNNPIFWQPSPDPAAYTLLLRAADAAIHGVDPAATVVSGGLAPAATGGGWIAPVDFLSGIYAHGGEGSFDAVGWHPYDFPAMPGTGSDNAWSEVASTTPSARSLMVAHGDGAKRIWATEFGAPTCTGDPTCVSEAAQAQAITTAFQSWRSAPWAGPLIAYTYSDTGSDQANREDFFGLVRLDGSLKPAYAAFHAAAIVTG